ncbi:MAG: FecR family protein [Macellibacteroides fermentans]|uniref:FecR family protein n=1 Tax=Macellibacteroides fermentans TaxID=879969 RepID=UPI003AD12C42
MDDTLLQAYFEGVTTDEQSRMVTEWLDQDEVNLIHYQRLCRIYEISLWNEGLPQESGSGKKKRLWPKILQHTIQVAAIFTLGFFFSQYFFMQEEEIKMQKVEVPPGQNSLVTLADGSKVWLNAGSTLHFPTRFSNRERLVTLNGEGFFEVRANKEKPFIVSASGYRVKALGTSFNVYAYKQSDEFETALLTGKVEIATPNSEHSLTLSPNNKAILEKGSLKTQPIENIDYFLWREGIICFNEPLSGVLKKLELYFNVTIEVNNKLVRQNEHCCVGKFRTRDGLEHILKVLQLTNHFTYQKDDVNNRVTIN